MTTLYRITFRFPDETTGKSVRWFCEDCILYHLEHKQVLDPLLVEWHLETEGKCQDCQK